MVPLLVSRPSSEHRRRQDEQVEGGVFDRFASRRTRLSASCLPSFLPAVPLAYKKLTAKIAALGTDLSPEDGDGKDALRAAFREALDNDLNTSLAVTVLYDVLKARISDGAKRELIEEFDTVLGLGLLAAAESEKEETAAPPAAKDPALIAYIEEKIEARRAAKAAKDYAEADRIRAELSARGVTLTDTKEGTTYTVAED